MKIYKSDYIDPEQLYPLIGNNIRILRRQQQMTQEQLAEVIDTDQKYISKIESGKARPGLSVYLQIANSLQVSIDDLLVGVIAEKPEMAAADIPSVFPQIGRAERHLMHLLQNAVYQYLKEKE